MGKEDERKFAIAGIAFEIVIICLLGGLFKYDNKPMVIHGQTVDDGGINFYYPMYQDVHVMVFVGFGFLMTYLQKHSWGSVGFNMMIAAFAIQWAIVTHGIFKSLWEWDKPLELPIGIKDLITADFAAAACLISFGAIVGRASPLQLLVMVFFELIFFNISEQLGANTFKAVDMGGSIFVHVFGAYFGLATSWAMSRKKSKAYHGHPLTEATKTTDTFAMIGTLFLFVYWPSFTGALAQEQQKYRVVINTLLALCASTSMTFCLSAILRPEHKFSMVDVQNATLAGGVAVGSACDLVIQPWGALLIGFVAALFSNIGYVHISPFLEKKLGLFDTCGVHNLHAIPGVQGGLAGVLCALIADDGTYGGQSSVETIYPARAWRSQGEQASYQAAALFATWAIAVVSGVFVGSILNLKVFEPVELGDEYDDRHFWIVPHDEEKAEDDRPVPQLANRA